MRRIAIAVTAGLLCASPIASAGRAAGIAPGAVAGIKLGMTRAQTRGLLAKPVLAGRLEDGYDRLGSDRQRVEVYFRKGARGAVVVATWNRAFTTAKHIGPCSTVAALKAAYGRGLRPFRAGGKVLAYRLGALIFTTEGRGRVGVVALGRGAAAAYVALNVRECR